MCINFSFQIIGHWRGFFSTYYDRLHYYSFKTFFMKKLFWIILFFTALSFTERSNAQLRKIPARATNSMHAWYPDAKNIVWRDKITNCQASFNLNGIRYEAKFSRKGHWKGSEAYVTENSLPITVRDGFRKSKYKNWKVRSSYVIYVPGEKTRYHVRVAKNGLRQKELVFTMQGQLVKDKMAI